MECVTIKQGKKEQPGRCCTADVCLRRSVNQLYNSQKMAKFVLVSTAWLPYTVGNVVICTPLCMRVLGFEDIKNGHDSIQKSLLVSD